MAEDQILDEKCQWEFETVFKICKSDAEQNRTFCYIYSKNGRNDFMYNIVLYITYII